MSTAFGCPQGGVRPMWTHVDRGESKPDFFVDVINGWPLGLQQLSAFIFHVVWCRFNHIRPTHLKLCETQAECIAQSGTPEYKTYDTELWRESINLPDSLSIPPTTKSPSRHSTLWYFHQKYLLLSISTTMGSPFTFIPQVYLFAIVLQPHLTLFSHEIAPVNDGMVADYI